MIFKILLIVNSVLWIILALVFITFLILRSVTFARMNSYLAKPTIRMPRYSTDGYKLVLAENITEEEVYSFLRTAGDTGGYYVWGANGADTDMLSIEIDRGELTIYIYDEMVFHIQESENDFSYTEIILNDELGFTSYIVDEISNELGIEDRQRFLSFFEFVYVGE